MSEYHKTQARFKRVMLLWLLSLMAVYAALFLAIAAEAMAGDYRTRPTLDGFKVTKRSGQQVFHHSNERLGGSPAPRCYKTGRRTDCYWKQPPTASRYR